MSEKTILDEVWSMAQSVSAHTALIAWVPQYNRLIKGLGE